jgi:hypothetical protein
MKILAVGLAARDAAALGILAALAIKDARCDSVAYRRGQALPAADLYVVDLLAVGLSRWSVAAEAELLQMLHGRPAVVLRPVREEAWAKVHAGLHGGATPGLADQALRFRGHAPGAAGRRLTACAR